MTSTPAYIYTLCEPDTGDVRYVGKTKDPYHRFYHHIAESDARSHRNPYKSRWIQKLRRQGKRPLIQIIEETNEESWQERERYWIAFYCEKGARLTNIQPGGEGGLSPQSAAKLAESMRGHPVSPATREKLRRANLGKKHTAETVATMRSVRTGVAHSAEWGERISATKLERYAAVLAERGTFTCGHPFTPENTYTWTHIDRRSAYGRTRIEYECRECKKERRKRRKRERERTQGGMPTC